MSEELPDLDSRHPLHVEFLRIAARDRSRALIADSTGTDLTAGQTLLASLALRRVLARTLSPETRMVGLLLPPSVGGVLANIACSLLGKIPVNLNYISSSVLNACVAQCGIRQILTSQRFWQRVQLQTQAEIVFLEDVRGRVRWTDKLAAWAAAQLPGTLRERLLGLHRHGLQDLATVVFSSGSTGDPKGIMLSHRNILSNIEGIRHRVRLGPEDRVVGVLPFFHSLGLTGTLWGPLLLGVKAAYHPDPRDTRGVGELVHKYRATVLMATPTFLRMYCRRCEPEQLQSLDWVLAGGEKLPTAVAEEFEKRFGIEPLEGYGCTELSPVVALNVPDSRLLEPGTCMRKAGTVGRPLPGVQTRVVDPERFEPVSEGQEGLLLVKGPNVMTGYLGRPDLTAEAVRDGWYVTGDIVRIEDGFIRITDRLNRFSKLGGEMVPHLHIEEALGQLLPPADHPTFVVTAVPDARKGERLVVLHTGLPKPPGEIVQQLRELGLPNLWIPSADSFFEVQQVPILGSGKVDLKGARQAALECVAKQPAKGPGGGAA